jgi:hypothetical protein
MLFEVILVVCGTNGSNFVGVIRGIKGGCIEADKAGITATAGVCAKSSSSPWDD